MTHSLHRQGRISGLRNDFVVMAMASKGINDEGAGPKLKRYLSIIHSHNPVNMGGLKVGNTCRCAPEDIIRRAGDYVSTFNGVFTGPEAVKQVLSALIKEDLGLSIVVSGLYEETARIARELGIKPHTVNHSLGVWGRRELLPGPEVMEITTMCGHGMISKNLVEKYIRLVAHGYDPEKAAREMGRLCYCAIFNVARAAAILERAARAGEQAMEASG